MANKNTTAPTSNTKKPDTGKSAGFQKINPNLVQNLSGNVPHKRPKN